MTTRLLHSPSPARRPRFSRASLLAFSAGALLAFGLTPSWAGTRTDVPENPEFKGPPAKFWVENLPATPDAQLPRAPQPRSLPAFGPAETRRKGIGIEGIAVPPANAWVPLGPFPIPNGQTSNRVDPVSGRVSAIVVNPTNAGVVYVGTAQGGLYRSLDGGASWKQLMDGAAPTNIGAPTAIGSLALNPQDSSMLFVGTGEGNLSADSFFGSGFYIITGADGANPVVNGPYNAQASNGADIFTGRSIVGIAVDPTNANNIFVSTSSGIGGIISSAYSVVPARGLYRCTNALAGINAVGTPTWTRLQITGTTNTNTISTAVVMDPGDPNTVVVAYYGQATGDPSGIYRTTNALAATPTFTGSRTLAANAAINHKLAISRTGSTVTVYATTSEGSASAQGRLYKSTNGGATFGTAITAVNGFAGGQGFYDIAVGVDPTNANNLSIGGSTGNNIHRYSKDGGATFPSGVTGLHADVHAIAFAPSNSSVLYHGNDGGIWKSLDGGLNWVSLNNGTFSATQFSGIALHPTDRNFTLGGTQDNGTIAIRPDGSIYRADFGDGGFSLIDQNATDTTTVTQYHTYFNQTNNLIGTGRTLTVPCATEGEWSFHGIYTGVVDTTPYCDGTTDTFNGILLTDAVNFYAPMTLGPGNPNTWYFGTDKLYRSTDRADTAPVASQLLDQTTSGTPPTGTPVSSIAISPQDDNVRIVGLNNGKVFATFTGSNALLQIAGTGATNGSTATPATAVGRIKVDPNNKTVAYIGFGGFGTAGTPISHVYKVTGLDQLGAATPGNVTITPAASGLPDIPVNALAIDPQSLSAGSSTDIYAGTDNGVYISRNGGSTWAVFGTGFPHVAVFGLEIQDPKRLIRAATHGRGFYETFTAAQPNSPLLSKVTSRKTHGSAGTFDINMPQTGPTGVECRSGGANGDFTAVLTFTTAILSGNATVTGGTGSVSGTPTFNGTEMIVNLTGVTNSQNLTITVSNVTDTNANVLASAPVTLGFLLGDTTADRNVNAGDAAQTRANSGKVVDASTFRTDVTADGTINSGDASLVKAQSGTGPLP